MSSSDGAPVFFLNGKPCSRNLPEDGGFTVLRFPDKLGCDYPIHCHS
jgi:hypothetical protein